GPPGHEHISQLVSTFVPLVAKRGRGLPNPHLDPFMNRKFLRSALLPMVCAFVLAYGCDSSEDDGLDDVRVFTAAAEISGVTGSGAINPTQLFATLGGPILMVDGASGSIVLLGTDGVPSIFASRDEILAATGGMTASIGPLDQIRLGALAGQIVAVDSVSGLIVRFALDGTPTLHTTEAQVIQATGETEADLRLPRALTS